MSAWMQFIIIVSAFISVHCGNTKTVYQQNANMRYTNVSLAVSAGSSLSCSRLCYSEGCMVFNYNPVDLICELGILAIDGEVKTDIVTGWQMYLYAVDECDSSPCQNSGTCIGHIGYYVCSCVQGWGGSNCDTVIACISEWQGYQNSCYHFVQIARERDDAQDQCTSLVPIAHLVDIQSQDEHNYVVGYATPQFPIWIGAKYDVSSQEYVWTDGLLIEGGFTLWGNSEPTNIDEHCVMIMQFQYVDNGYYWADNDCYESLMSMCEYELP